MDDELKKPLGIFSQINNRIIEIKNADEIEIAVLAIFMAFVLLGIALALIFNEIIIFGILAGVLGFACLIAACIPVYVMIKNK